MSFPLVIFILSYFENYVKIYLTVSFQYLILYKSEFAHLRTLIIFTLILVVFRELAVTSMRLVVSTGEGIVIAANSLGKIKTVSQIVAISTVFLEPFVQWIAKLIYGAITGTTPIWRTDIVPLSWASLIISLVMTVWSGINYIKGYWKYLDPEK